jgi:ketosteroid isomerase-like protein
MSTGTRPSAIETDNDAVQAANLDFYRAFGSRDLAAMEAIWAKHVPVMCLHPGWAAIEGRDAVMASWRLIFSGEAEDFRVLCHDERAAIHGDVAIVLCEEELTGGSLAVTNTFIREGGAWRLIHHQGGAIIPQYHARKPGAALH